jgi:hypothetical protein
LNSLTLCKPLCIAKGVRQIAKRYALVATLMLQCAAHAQDAPGPQPTDAPPTTLPPVEVVAPSPLIGSGVDRNAVTAESHVLNRDDLRRDRTSDLVRSLDQQVSGVSLDSA